jgi:hypothetical protein
MSDLHARQKKIELLLNRLTTERMASTSSRCKRFAVTRLIVTRTRTATVETTRRNQVTTFTVAFGLKGRTGAGALSSVTVDIVRAEKQLEQLQATRES